MRLTEALFRPQMRFFRVLLVDAVGNVCTKPTKSILALIGIAMGTAAVITLLHIGAIARTEALQSFESIGADFVTVLAPVGSQDREQLRPDDVANIPLHRVGLVDAAPMIRGSSLIFEGHSQVPADIVGTTPNLMSLLHLTLRSGRFISMLDGFAPFAVIGAGIADQLAAVRGHPIAIGERVHIGEQIFRIVGVLAPQPLNPLNGLEPNKLVIVNLNAVRRLLENVSIESVAARLSPGKPVEDMTAAVTAYFRRRLRGAEVHFVLASELIANIGRQMQIYDTLLLAIGGVSLTIGGIGIMNVMLMSVMERKEEVGLRIAVGASPRSISLMFLMESMVLAAAGSMLGLVLGVAAAWGLARQSGWTFSFAPPAIPLGIGMAVVVGLFFGIYPARRAASLHPVVALRRE